VHAQAEAALVLLEQLRAEPRKESLDVANAQVVSAQTTVKAAQDAYEKQQAAFAMDSRAISRNALDSAGTAVAAAKANLEVARKQRDLMKAGAWSFEIRNQERQYEALDAAYRSANALLGKYTLRAPTDGRVLAINSSEGAYVSAQGAYNTYSQGMNPVITLASAREADLQVRCFVDEILVARLPAPERMQAQMSARGSSVKIPLRYLRTQPILSPKIQLSDQRQERVDVRVLPIIFRFAKPAGITLYPGQLVDVFIGSR
jgi:HlyD family secretion protein